MANLSSGAQVLFAQCAGLEPLIVTIISAGPHTVRYREPNGVERSLTRTKFTNRVRRAAGLAHVQPKGKRRSVRTIETPQGGQPGFRRK